jgi:hypothetical protein
MSRVPARKTPKSYSSSLKPLNKISISIGAWYTGLDFYKRQQEAKEEAETIKRVQREEELKTVLLSKIHLALNQNYYFQTEGKTTTAVVIPVPRKLRDELDEILKHKEFLGYNIEVTKTVKDAQHLFESFPIFLKVSDKVGVS